MLFVVCLIPLSVILRKTKGKYQLSKEDESINHLLFMDDLKLYGSDERQVDSLINTVRVLSDDIRMEFGLKRCRLVVMKRSKVIKYDGVDLPDGHRMKSVEEDGYKYLGILEYNEVLYAEMKIRLQNEYYRRLKRILKSKLNGKNVIMSVNIWAVSVLRYRTGVINWTKAELESIDRKTRKQVTICGMLHPRVDVQRFYMQRGQGGRGLKSVRLEEAGLAHYVQSSTRPLMVAVAKERLPLKEKTLTQKQLKEQKELERAEGWKNKPLRGQFLRQTEEIRDNATWDWLRKGI